jgi:hypothetical protein
MGYAGAQVRPTGRRGNEEIVLWPSPAGAARIVQHGDSGTTGDIDPGILEHHLLTNEFWVALVRLERSFPDFEGEFVSSSTRLLRCYPDRREGAVTLVDVCSCPPSSDETLIPDAVFTIRHKVLDKRLLFFLETDMDTEPLTRSKAGISSIQGKLATYQRLFISEAYRQCERVWSCHFIGFRVLFVTVSTERLNSLCNFVAGKPSTNFVWFASEEALPAKGLAERIWVPGGGLDRERQSILGKVVPSSPAAVPTKASQPAPADGPPPPSPIQAANGAAKRRDEGI